MKRLLHVILLSLCVLSPLMANQGVKISQIKISGLVHVSRSTLLNYLPIKVGQVATDDSTEKAIQALYKTGFFSQVKVSLQQTDLFVQVTERPVIAQIDVQGAHEIKKEQINTLLDKIGLVVGQRYQKNLIKMTKTILQKNYVSIGYYGVGIDIDVKTLNTGRVSITIHIDEGKVVVVKKIRIIGSKVFSEATLLKQFQMTTTRLWSFITHGDRFSQQKLQADLESLRSFYYDRGYLDFTIVSHHVSLSPSGAGVYIEIHVAEGDLYRIARVDLGGDLLDQSEHLHQLLTVRTNQIFSRKALRSNLDAMKQYLANRGYAYADVQVTPLLNRSTRQVVLKLKVVPGQLIYVKNITFAGNTLTRDNVLRRELRQQEGALFSYKGLEESKRRLRNLGYMKDIESSVTHVPGYTDQVNVDFSMKEKPNTALNFQVAYSGAEGLMYGINWQQPNALGSGKDFSIALNKGHYASSASVNFYEPYFTQSGISQSLGFSYTKTTPDKVDLSDYSIDNSDIYVNYGIPLSDTQSMGLGFGYDGAKLHTKTESPQHIKDFVTKYGSDFKLGFINTSWTYSHFDQANFPTKGWQHQLFASVYHAVSGNDLSYYTAAYGMEGYAPLTSKLVLHARANAKYGNGFGSTDEFPPFRNFYAGGIGSVAGYEPNSLGPKDSNNKPLGGNVDVDGSLSVIAPVAFSEDARVYLFVDGGNVFQDKIKPGQLRYSAGIGLMWRTLIPLQFTLAKAINPSSGDQKKVFDFTIGTSF